MITIVYGMGDTLLGTFAYTVAVLLLFNEGWIGIRYFKQEIKDQISAATILGTPIAAVRGFFLGLVGFLPLIVDLIGFFVIFVIFRAGNGDSEVKTQGMLATIMLSMFMKLPWVVKFIKNWGYSQMRKAI